ncbi:hypothetical protein [Oscillatoria sp. FACHB-1406]|uniref:hypothetical protein n=1 Tax=Oscillatoria sp. FACHB-1406 TaxID=2692846 RepID=UPI00168A2A07|nr:hypothetical protein [Oscillatoria sp. FACHB-1406]MBD2576352.1 hypothetical protein [Oscillatoria sp. FACHB-1406]
MTISTQKDIRVKIISRIWAYATVMFFIDFAFLGQVQERKMLFLPATIVFGAATSTIVVLRKLRDRPDNILFPSETLKELQQRIENLEAIAVSDASPSKLYELHDC